MFENTRNALKVFQDALECSQCKTPKKALQYLGTSCKHAQCWNCIEEMTKKVPGKRSTTRNHCSTCAFPLDTTKIVGAHVLNTCFDTLEELSVLLEKAKSAPPMAMTQAALACTQRIFDELPENEPIDKKEAIEKFLETQAHMPDLDEEEHDDNDKKYEKISENRENHEISPELDIFHDYGTECPSSSTKRTSSKRPPNPSDDNEYEMKPKRTSILKRAAQKVELPTPGLFESQIQTRTHPNEMLTPFVNRRSTAPSASIGGKVGLYADPLRSASYESKSDKKQDAQMFADNDPFMKKIVYTRRKASASSSSEVKNENVPKIEEEEQVSEQDEVATRRRNSVRFDPRRSQSPMSFGEKSMASLKGEQRRSSYGTRRGEVVIINSILNHRIPQLRTAVEEGTCVNERDNQGKTPLFIAVEQNSLDAVEILVDAGAVINACCGANYETTLHEAIRRKNHQIIEYLLTKGASMKIKNSAGKTPEDLGMADAKIRKILDKFKNEHVLQPVIPPPKSKIHFVQLIDEKMISDSDKRKLPGKINLVSAEMDAPTHVVVAVDLKTKILNISKEHIGEVLKAIIRSGMIVSREWLKACIIDPSKVDEDRAYAVKKVQWMDGPIYSNRIEEWKKTITKMQPKLFAGCKFYFPRPKYNFLDRATLIEIVRSAGGQASTREPIINEKDAPPYHNSRLRPNFIVYSLTHDIGEKFRDCTKYNLVCEQWLIEAILGCSISTAPY